MFAGRKSYRSAARAGSGRRIGRTIGVFSVFGLCMRKTPSSLQPRLTSLLTGMVLTCLQEERAIGALLGLAVGDALGAPLEFSQLNYKRNTWNEMGQQDVWEKSQIYNRTFKVKSGQWTDDTSMALCLADSLFVKQGFDPVDQRLRYHNWYYHGYNNAFGADTKRKSQVSIGLGENTEAGDSQTSGNGPLMRAAPVPIFYASCSEDCVRYAYLQIRATHQGHEAAECSMLLAYVLWKAVNHASTGDVAVHTAVESMVVREILTNLKQELEDTLMKVILLVQYVEFCTQAKRVMAAPSDVVPLRRVKENDTYVGSYAMDALAMAFHCVWSTATYRDAVLKSANLGGDADTVSAITGQIAGAIYGVGAIPKAWVDAVQQWDRQGEIALKAVRLHREGLQVSDQPPNSTLQASTAASPGRSEAFSPLPATSLHARELILGLKGYNIHTG
eukprot:g26653.t1